MAINTTVVLSDLVQGAYAQAVEFAFMAENRFAQFGKTKTWDRETEPVPGDTITFTVIGAMTAATGALSETADPDPQSMDETQKTLTLYEYGKLVKRTNKLKFVSFADIDLAIGEAVGQNMGLSVDLLARNVLDGMTAAARISYVNSNVYATGITASDVLSAADVRRAYNKLDRANVPEFESGFYAAVLHSDCFSDLKAETGSGAWRTPREYVDPEDIYNGERGEFEGFRFLTSTNARLTISGASGSVDLYSSYFIGYQAMAYAEAVEPDLGISGPFDALQRLLNIYWYGLFSYGEFRPESLHTVFSASSYEV